MLTTMVALDGSGNKRARRPLSRRYSVMPSTEATRVMPLGACAWARLSPAVARTSKKYLRRCMVRSGLGEYTIYLYMDSGNKMCQAGCYNFNLHGQTGFVVRYLHGGSAIS